MQGQGWPLGAVCKKSFAPAKMSLLYIVSSRMVKLAPRTSLEIRHSVDLSFFHTCTAILKNVLQRGGHTFPLGYLEKSLEDR